MGARIRDTITTLTNAAGALGAAVDATDVLARLRTLLEGGE